MDIHCPYYRVLINDSNQKKDVTEKIRQMFKVWQYNNLERFLYKNADGIICTTDEAKKMICEHSSTPVPIEVIPNAARFLGCEIKKDKDGILYLGQLYPRKGVDVLIKALQYLPDRRLIIVGGNKENDVLRVKKLTSELGVSDRITFTGYVIPKEIGKYFSQAAVGVIPIIDIYRTQFTSPMKLFEYMAAKIPIVASDLPAIREIVENGKTAILVKPGDPKALAKGIEKILNDKNLAKNIAEKAYEKVQHFTYEKKASRIIEFLEEIMTR